MTTETLTHQPVPNGKQPNPTAELILVTPEVALDWLTQNDQNRNVRERKVNLYAEAIRRDDWMITGEGVKFDWNGRLIDGQHRLLAVVEAEVPVFMFVFRNLHPDAQLVLDTGAKRTAADALKFVGIKGCSLSNLAALARMAILWDEGAYRKSGASSFTREVTNSEVVDWAIANPDAITATAKADVTRRAVSCPGSVLAFAWLLFTRLDDEAATAFMGDLVNIRTSGPGDPIYTLLRRYRSAGSSKERLQVPQHLFLIFRTWNAWRAKEPLHQLKMGRAGSFGPISIPEPQ